MSNEPAATVLVVDDNPSKRYTISRLLRSAGYNVLEAASGQQALDMAAEDPDVIVLDVNLPDIDGFEVCRILRTRETTLRTPIIHLSATFVEASDKVHGLNMGADGYLTHPVEPPVLIATVNAFIRTRNAEERLRLSEGKFRAIFDQALNGIALISAQGEFIEANPAMCRILGVAEHDVVGMPWSRFVPSNVEEHGAEMFRELQLHGEWSGTFPLQRVDEAIVHLDWNVSRHSIPGVWLAVVTDITRQRSAEAERDRLHASERVARSEAERANRLKDDFLATISHELRSPLQAILGWSQVLKMRASDDVNVYRAGIEVIDRNARAQAQLIADLLDVSRITSGKLRLELKEVDLADLMRHALDNVRQIADGKGVKMEAQIGATNIAVSGDPGRLQQVLNNLLTNAIKFTPAAGRIVIRAEIVDSEAMVSVADDGQGISAEFLPHIFDTFRQEDAASTRFHEGLGLGLAIVKRLVEMHGGTVVASSPGEMLGSTFTVRLPLIKQSTLIRFEDGSERSQETQIDIVKVLRGLRVLVVDDDADARSFVKRLLVEYAAIATEASTVAQAMAHIRKDVPQVLVSDISMPGEDGYALIRQVREAGYTAERLPAIALTAFAHHEDRARALASGFQAHMAKPIDLESLLRAIARVAPRAN